MRRGLAASKRSKAARRQAAPGLRVFVGTTLASMACLCCCAHSRPQGCPRRSGCRLSAAAGRTNGAHECSSRGGQAIRTGAMRAAHLRRGAPCNDESRHRGPARASPASGPGGRGWPGDWLLLATLFACGSDASSRETGTKATYSSRVERQLDVHEPVNVVRHRRHAAPRRKRRPGNDVDRATAAPALLVVRVRLL